MSTLYSHLKFLRFQDHIKALRDREVVAPVHLRIKPTNRCNHDCWYCAYKVNHLRLGEDMVEEDTIPEEKMGEIVSDIISMGVRAVTFSGGGEPLLYKPLPRVVERLTDGGVVVAALTNGANLKGELAQVFAHRATWIRISIDSWDDASYQKARNLRGPVFTRLLENMQRFTDLGGSCVLGVSFILTAENCHHLPEAIAQFKAAGANHVKLSGVVVANDGGENNNYHSNMTKIVHEKIREACSLADNRFSVINHYHELEERFDKHYTYCPFLQFLSVIGADGRVYACQDKAYTQSGLLGEIRHRSFRDYWFSAENKNRLFSLNPELDCRHHCVTHAKNEAILQFLDLDPQHGLFV